MITKIIITYITTIIFAIIAGLTANILISGAGFPIIGFVASVLITFNCLSKLPVWLLKEEIQEYLSGKSEE